MCPNKQVSYSARPFPLRAVDVVRFLLCLTPCGQCHVPVFRFTGGSSSAEESSSSSFPSSFMSRLCVIRFLHLHVNVAKYSTPSRSYSYIAHSSNSHFFHHAHNLINVRFSQIQAFHRIVTQTIYMFQHHLPRPRTPLIHKLGHYTSKPPIFPTSFPHVPHIQELQSPVIRHASFDETHHRLKLGQISSLASLLRRLAPAGNSS